MAFVKKTHRGNKGNRLPRPSGFGRKFFHLFDRLENFHFSESVSLFRPHWNEIPGTLAHLFDFSQQLFEIFFSLYEIDFARIHHEQGSLVVVEEIKVVGFD
jgi:hypothetical protein